MLYQLASIVSKKLDPFGGCNNFYKLGYPYYCWPEEYNHISSDRARYRWLPVKSQIEYHSLCIYVRYTDNTVLISVHVCHLIHQLVLVLNIIIPPDLRNDLLILIAVADCQEHSILFDMQLLAMWWKLSDDIAKSHAFSRTVYINIFCVGDYNFP